MTPVEVLFSLIIYRDGRMSVIGEPTKGTVQEVLPGILRTIADAIESGATVLNKEQDGDG